MTGNTIGAETPVMRLHGTMAGNTIWRGNREIDQRSGIQVALRAIHIDVAACQLKCEIVFERFTKAIHPIVTIEAGIAIRQGMRQGKRRVHLAVAGLAGIGGKGGDIAVMTVSTGE